MPGRHVAPPSRRSGRAVVASVVAGAALAGCGSETVGELPAPAGPLRSPAAATAPAGFPARLAALPADVAASRGARETPVDGGARTARVLPRERAVVILDGTGRELARASAGVGPTNAVSNDKWLWVADTRGDALLVFRLRPTLQLVRRVYLAGGPYALALDREKLRLWVTLTGSNEVVELPAHGRPHELRRFPTPRQPDVVGVDRAVNRVYVGGAGGRYRLIDPPPLA